MTITIINQKPVVLDPVHTISCQGDYDPLAALRAQIVDPLFTPLNASQPCQMTTAAGQDLDADGLSSLLLSCLGDVVVPDAETATKQVLGQCLVHFDQATPIPVNETFAIQAASAHKLPTPGPNVIYTARDDVIPTAKALLAGSGSQEKFFASLAYTFPTDTLGFWFQTEIAFDEFKAWLDQQVQLIASVLPSDTVKLLSDFSALKLNGLTEALRLRVDDTDGNDEYSFPRFIVFMLMTYIEQQRSAQQTPGTTAVPVVGVLPFTLSELFCPRTIVLVNVEAHARSTPNKVTKEWKTISQALASPIKIVSLKSLSKLTALQRAVTKAQVAGAVHRPGQPGSRSAKVTFRKQAPSKIDLFKAIKRVLTRMGKVNRSMNIFRASKATFLKANRRDPDDVNKTGRITSVTYMPDLHVYVDTSGSISEENYQDSVTMLIKIAKKLNVNLYFNSFSNILSQETLLRVQDKSVDKIWAEFRRVPKVTGGTDYLQIWNYVNASPVRRRRLSLVITDFEWYPPSGRHEHPANLYYAPCSAMNWNSLIRSAKAFSRGMKHIDPAITQRLLGMIL